MATVAYIILCHQNADDVCKWVDAHLAQGCYAAVHFDQNGNDADFQKLQDRFGDNPDVCLVPRIRCGWGEWSLVSASLNALELAVEQFTRATHFFLTSGDCAPIKPAKYVADILDQENKDFIEHHDFVNSGWIKTGMVKDRFKYRHFFNERKSKRWFYISLKLQRMLGLSRKTPAGLDMKIGSQWWCLRRRTVDSILDFTKQRRDVMWFFKSVWIPDECFFQTLVAHLVPSVELINHPPTYLKFSDYGMPVTFHADHFDFLKGQNRFFARKISHNSAELRQLLIEHYGDESHQVEIEDNGENIYNFLVQSGRKGQRFARRFWEKGQTVGRERKLSIILCKDWHLGERVLKQICEETQSKGFTYLFNDQNVSLPDLGGIQNSIEKRSRHRRAVMRLLFEDQGVDHLYICIDPASKAIVDDFYDDECEVRTLHVRMPFSPRFCAGHAYRTGVLNNDNGDGTDPISKSIKLTLDNEVTEIQGARYGNYYEVNRNKHADTNSKIMADFLERGHQISDAILTNSGYLKKEG